ncbi:MAG: MerR family transcriptional regulator [Candidatus Coproplasma sp.]
MSYSVGEAAKILGVAPSALRYYDKEGLLPGTKRSQGGARVFDENDFETLKIIACLKNSGMQIKEIKKFIDLCCLGDSTIGERLELFINRKEEIEKQIAELNATLETVKFKCWYYETAKKLGSTKACDELPDEDLPEDIRAERRRLKDAVRLNR